MRFAFLTSTPPSPIEGSGTFVALDGLLHGLRDRGHEANLRAIRVRTGFHTLDRWLYNAQVALSPPRADVVVGLDLDGFLWARRSRRPPFVVALKGIIADELRNERGWVRTLLTLQARWERLNCERADRVIVPSEYSANVAGDLYSMRVEKLAVVPEPIDLAGWRRLFAAVEHRSPRRPTVLSVARMYRRKRLRDLLLAAQILKARIPDVEIRVVGTGPEFASLVRLAAVLGLEHNVRFLGDVRRNRLAVEYVSAHCFCLPTVQEGFGLVFLEAMAAGLPIVACRAAAVPEVVGDTTGLLVRPRNPEDLAEALEELLLHEGLRRRCGDAGRARVEAFDCERVARQFLSVVTG